LSTKGLELPFKNPHVPQIALIVAPHPQTSQ
jgi:hypothetical protein